MAPCSLLVPQALAKLVNAGFKPENFPVEGGYKDGSLAHVLERLMAYAALSERFSMCARY